MSGPERRLEGLLAGLGAGHRRVAPGPDLAARSPCRVRRGQVLARHDERRDPLTGHRGVAEGLHLLVRAGGWLVDLQLRDERGGVVLRGQVLPSTEGQAAPVGALVHAWAGDAVVMACVDGAGEFVLPGLPAAGIDRLVLELEDEVHELPWPNEAAP